MDVVCSACVCLVCLIVKSLLLVANSFDARCCLSHVTMFRAVGLLVRLLLGLEMGKSDIRFSPIHCQVSLGA